MSIPGILPPAAWGDASGSSGGGGGGGGSSTLIQTLQSLGLTTGLQLCLDAGDATSYSGTGQQWSDTSGNACHFYRGASSSSESSDPTFNGSAGSGTPTNYWSFDGGDYFTLVGSNPAWVNTLHKDNAKFAFCGWFYYTSLPAVFFADSTTSSGAPVTGISLSVSSASANKLRLSVGNGTGGGGALNVVSSATFSSSAWQFFAVRVDEAGNARLLQIDGTQETSTCTYSSPSASDATTTATIGTFGDHTNTFPNGTRLANLVAWQGATIPANSDLLSVYNSTKAGFGL